MIGLVLTALAGAALLPGTYSNEEQVELARKAGKPLPAWAGLVITGAETSFKAQPVNSFGVSTGPAESWRVRAGKERVQIASGTCVRDFAVVPKGLTIVNRTGRCAGGLTTVTAAGLAMTAVDGKPLEFQRARAFTCLVGGKGWTREALKLHDAGGRALVAGNAAGQQRYVLHLRHIAWPPPGVPESLLLSVRQGDVALGQVATDPAARWLAGDFGTVRMRCARSG